MPSKNTVSHISVTTSWLVAMDTFLAYFQIHAVLLCLYLHQTYSVYICYFDMLSPGWCKKLEQSEGQIIDHLMFLCGDSPLSSCGTSALSLYDEWKTEQIPAVVMCVLGGDATLLTPRKSTMPREDIWNMTSVLCPISWGQWWPLRRTSRLTLIIWLIGSSAAEFQRHPLVSQLPAIKETSCKWRIRSPSLTRWEGTSAEERGRPRWGGDGGRGATDKTQRAKMELKEWGNSLQSVLTAVLQHK